jgi:nucleoside-diphosphate kinase
MKTLTFAMIKPDAVAAEQIGGILSFTKGHFTIVDMVLLHLSKSCAEEFYAEHKGKPFYAKLIEFTISGPVVCLVLEAENVVDKWRELMGATNPKDAGSWTIRHRYGEGMPNNAVHGSASDTDALREMALFYEWVAELHG